MPIPLLVLVLVVVLVLEMVGLAQRFRKTMTRPWTYRSLKVPLANPKIPYRERIWNRSGLFGETHRQIEDEDDDEYEDDLVRSPLQGPAPITFATLN